MLRIQALRIYRREYLHALRNGKDALQAAEQATTRVKKLILEDHGFQSLPEYDRMDAWGEILGVLIEWTILLKDIPIDTSKLPAKPPLVPIKPVEGPS